MSIESVTIGTATNSDEIWGTSRKFATGIPGRIPCSNNHRNSPPVYDLESIINRLKNPTEAAEQEKGTEESRLPFSQFDREIYDIGSALQP